MTLNTSHVAGDPNHPSEHNALATQVNTNTANIATNTTNIAAAETSAHAAATYETQTHATATYEQGGTATVHLASDGNDANSGKVRSQAKATLAAAVAALPAAGGRVLVSPGTYAIAPISLPKNTAIIGTPAFDKTTQPGVVFTVTSTTTAAFTVDSGCLLQGFEVWYPNQSCTNGGSPTVYPSTFVAAANSQRVLFRDIIARNPYVLFDFSASHTLYEVDSVKAFPLHVGVIVDLAADIDRFSRIDFNPGYLSNLLGVSTMASYNDWVYKNGTAFQVQRSDFTTFTDCAAYGYLRGAWLLLSSNTVDTPDNVRFTACDFDACSLAVVMDYGRDAVFTGCDFTSRKWDASLTGNSDTCVQINPNAQSARFVSCRFLDCDKEVLRINGAQNVIVTGSIFRNWATDGTGTYAAVNVIGNTTASHYTRAIITSNAFEWSPTTQSNNLKKGVTLDGTNTQHRALVSGNNFFAIGNVGIQAFAGSDNYIVTNNIFENCALASAFQGTPTNTLTTGNLTVAT